MTPLTTLLSHEPLSVALDRLIHTPSLTHAHTALVLLEQDRMGVRAAVRRGTRQSPFDNSLAAYEQARARLDAELTQSDQANTLHLPRLFGDYVAARAHYLADWGIATVLRSAPIPPADSHHPVAAPDAAADGAMVPCGARAQAEDQPPPHLPNPAPQKAQVPPPPEATAMHPGPHTAPAQAENSPQAHGPQEAPATSGPEATEADPQTPEAVADEPSIEVWLHTPGGWKWLALGCESIQDAAQTFASATLNAEHPQELRIITRTSQRPAPLDA